MLKENPLYPTPPSEQIKKNILALTPVGHKNQMTGLLLAYKNSIIKEIQTK